MTHPRPILLLGLLAAGLTAAQPAASPAPARPTARPNVQPAAAPAREGANERLITITYDGGTRNSPDLRYGPYVYAHPDPEGVVAEAKFFFASCSHLAYSSALTTLNAIGM